MTQPRHDSPYDDRVPPGAAREIARITGLSPATIKRIGYAIAVLAGDDHSDIAIRYATEQALAAASSPAWALSTRLLFEHRLKARLGKYLHSKDPERADWSVLGLTPHQLADVVGDTWAALPEGSRPPGWNPRSLPGSVWSTLAAPGFTKALSDRLGPHLRTLATRRAAELTLDLAKPGDQVQWISRRDNQVRHTHVQLDGTTQPTGVPFRAGPCTLRYPGDSSALDECWRGCVDGSTLIDWTSTEIFRATRRRYEGTLLELTTTRGHTLTVTPNHPILTLSGYKPAGTLKQGDDVLGTLQPPAPEVDHRPASIEEFFRAAAQIREPRRVTGSSVDFHGDGSDSEVEIVDTFGILPYIVDALTVEHRSQEVFLGVGVRDVPLSGDSQSMPYLSLTGAAEGTHGAVGLGDVGQPFLERHGTHPDLVGFAAGSDGQAHFTESQLDDIARDTEIIRHAQDALASQITGAYVLEVDGDSSTRVDGLRPLYVTREPRSAYLVADGALTDAEFHRHRADGLASGMEATQLTQVREFSGSHDVYNLETLGGWFSGNGILVHNCRCVLRLVPAK